jgi:hypothetical protein
MFRKTLSWFTTVFALGFAGMACTNPHAEAHKPADQVTQPQLATADKGPDTKPAPVKKLADQPVLAQHPPGADMDARKAAVESPAHRDTESNKDQSAPAAAEEKDVALTPPTHAVNSVKDSEELPVTDEDPADQALFARVARNDKDWSVRQAAVGRLTSQAVLAQIATSDEDLDIRKLAVSRLTVQAALARVATSDEDWSLRKTATERLTNQVVLARIAMSDADSDIRKLAVGMLTDQSALAHVAKSDKDWSVRRSAVTKLTDKAVLAQIATSDQDPDLRKLAVSRLTDQATTP